VYFLPRFCCVRSFVGWLDIVEYLALVPVFTLTKHPFLCPITNDDHDDDDEYDDANDDTTTKKKPPNWSTIRLKALPCDCNCGTRRVRNGSGR
jgi:hypothetical protein